MTLPNPVSLAPESDLAPVVPADEVTSLPEIVPAVEFLSEIPAEPETVPELVEKVSSVDVSEGVHASPELKVLPPGPAEETTPSDPPTEEIKTPISDIPPLADQATREEVPTPVLEATPPSPAAEAPPSSESPVQKVNIEPAAGEELISSQNNLIIFVIYCTPIKALRHF